MARTTVADVLVDGLTRAGVPRVFTVPGADAAALVAAMRRRGLDIVAAPDAVTAGVLAAVTGEIGDGPGAMVAGLDDAPGVVRSLAQARRDRAPLIVLTDAGADAVLLTPVVKASLVVEPPSAGHRVAHAARLAMTDPRGPVHLVVARDTVEEPALAVATSLRLAPLPPPAESLDVLGDALEAAARPLIVTGLECGPDDAKWVRAFAEALPAPVLSTAKGKGTLADPHPLALGPLAAGHAALARADLVVLVGVDPDELPPGVLPAGLAAARIGRAPWVGVAPGPEALGDLALVIGELAPRVRARPAADWDVAELDRIKRAVAREATAMPAGRVVARAREATAAGTLATADGPALDAWQAVAPREALSSLGRSTPGYAVAAAVAAQLVHRDRRVVAFTNPAGLTASEGAWAMAVALSLPIVVVVLGDQPAAGETTVTAELSRAFREDRPALVRAG